MPLRTAGLEERRKLIFSDSDESSHQTFAHPWRFTIASTHTGT